jgi:methylated-DNA-protein-cysteine methyltransferase related protein
MDLNLPPNFYEQVYAVVQRIPLGKVITYGRIAQMLGTANAARAVGYALRALPDKGKYTSQNVPWQRVINSEGRISNAAHARQQAALLQAEGVAVSPDLRIDLDKYLWEGLHWMEIDDILHRHDG